jgi:hypothetical protein
MDFVKHGYCGLYCGACPTMLATENGELEAFAQGGSLTPEELACYGCKSEKVAVFCRDCGLKRCAREKGFDFCHQCPDLPCWRVTEFMQEEEYPYHLGVLKNLDVIRQQGLDAWLSAQDNRWRCPACGTKFAWQDEVCRKCGQPAANYKADL